MRIKTTTLSAGPAGVVPADTVKTVPDAVGVAMIAADAAVEWPLQDVERKEAEAKAKAKAEAEAETASIGSPENAAAATGRGKPRNRGR